MTNSEVIIRTAAWIEERLREELPVPVIARKAGYSLHHFIRLFGAATGLPPKEYVLRRKLSEAARELSAGKRRVTDVAFEYGFNDLETFTRAFKRTLGATPRDVRGGASFAYLEPVSKTARAGDAAGDSAGFPSRGIVDEPVVERFDSFLLTGSSIAIRDKTDAVGRLWVRFSERAASIPDRVAPPRFFQLAWWSEDAEDSLEIMAGIRVSRLENVPMDLIGKMVPACDCLVFTHRGSMSSVGDSYQAIYGRWLQDTDRRPVLPFNFERYADDGKDPWSDGYSMEICVPVG
jgi:AraC family transcriptional regulator